ncbi:MAG TPA: hypothetical protein VF762_13340, partial [Blastocatellia bacterium]
MESRSTEAFGDDYELNLLCSGGGQVQRFFEAQVFQRMQPVAEDFFCRHECHLYVSCRGENDDSLNAVIFQIGELIYAQLNIPDIRSGVRGRFYSQSRKQVMRGRSGSGRATAFSAVSGCVTQLEGEMFSLPGIGRQPN